MERPQHRAGAYREEAIRAALELEYALKTIIAPPAPFAFAWCWGCLRIQAGWQSVRDVEDVTGMATWFCTACDRPWAELMHLDPCDACRLHLAVEALAEVETYGGWTRCAECARREAVRNWLDGVSS